MRLWAAEGRGQDWKKMRESKTETEKKGSKGRKEGERERQRMNYRLEDAKRWSGEKRKNEMNRF